MFSRVCLILMGCLAVSVPTIAADMQVQAVDKGCWVEIFDDDKYDASDPHVTVQGPMQSATLKNFSGRDWSNDIESLIMGSNATMHAYSDKDFKGTEISFTPNQRVPDLSDLKMANEIESLKITCGR
ncbi:MAG: hypothetical protein ACT4OO_00105 [Nitrospiraceae bacterium]